MKSRYRGHAAVLMFVFLALAHLNAREVGTIVQTGHTDGVRATCFSADGRLLGSGGKDGQVILWDLATRRELRALHGVSVVYALALSEDGRLAVAGGPDGQLLLWDAVTGAVRFRLDGHTKHVWGVVFSPDGTRLYSCSGDQTIRVWETASGRCLDTWNPAGRVLGFLSLSQDGRTLVTVDSGKTVYMIDTQRGKISRRFSADTLEVSAENGSRAPHDLKSLKEQGAWKSVAISRDGRFVAATREVLTVEHGSDACVAVWDARTGRLLHVFYDQLMRGVGFTPDGIFVYSTYNGVIVRDLATGKRLGVADPELPSCLAVSADGTMIASGSTVLKDYGVYVSDIKTGTRLAVLGKESMARPEAPRSSLDLRVLLAIDCSRDGASFATLTANHLLAMWNARSGRPGAVIDGAPIGATKFCFSPDSSSVLLGGREVALWSLYPLRLLWKWHPPEGVADSLAFSQDGKKIAVGLRDVPNTSMAQAVLLSTNTGQLLQTFQSFSGGVMPINPVRDRAWIDALNAYTTGKGRVDFEAMKRSGPTGAKNRPTMYGRPVEQIALSTNGAQLAMKVNLQGTLVFDTSSGKSIGRLGEVESALAFGPEGSRIAKSGFAGITDSLQGFAPKPDGGFEISAATLSPDGKTLALARSDTSIRLISLPSDEIRQTLRGNGQVAMKLMYNTAGTRLYSINDDGSLQVWSMPGGTEGVEFISDGVDFVALRDDGYYTASRGAWASIGFHLGEKAAMADQLELRFDRPDLVLKALGGDVGIVAAYNAAYRKRLRRLGFTEASLSQDSHVPEVSFETKPPVITEQTDVTLHVNASDSQFNLESLRVLVNDVPVFGSSGLSLRSQHRTSVGQAITVALLRGRNQIQVSALNEKGAESLKTTVEITCTAPAVKPDLYLVTVGVSKYRDPAYNLRMAAKDAKDVAGYFQTSAGLYDHVKVLSLLDAEATSEGVRGAKAFLMNSRPSDAAIVFVSGHGLLDASYDYYFATSDVDLKDLAHTAVPYSALEDLLDGIPARRKLLLMDTCHAGEVDKEEMGVKMASVSESKSIDGGRVRTRDLALRKASATPGKSLSLENSFDLMQELFANLELGSGAQVIAASAGAELSFESAQWNNGVFTYALLSGLESGHSDSNKDGQVVVSELKDYIAETVVRLTDGRQKPAARRESMEFDFPVARVDIRQPVVESPDHGTK